MDNYLLYLIAFIFLSFATVLFLTRNRWMSKLALPDYVYSRLPSSFQTDIEDGFTSDTFDLTENMLNGDTRAGLNNVAKSDIRKIMLNRRVNFDEARRLYMEQSFRNHGIAADGRPRDPKFVSFS